MSVTFIIIVSVTVIVTVNFIVHDRWSMSEIFKYVPPSKLLIILPFHRVFSKIYV